MPDSVLLPRVLPATISHHVGDRDAGRGLARARAGAVSELSWDPAESTITARVAEESGEVRRVGVTLGEYEEDSVSRRFLPPAPGGLWRPLRSSCDGPEGGDCEHAAAALHHLNDLAGRAEAEEPSPEWRSVLRPLLRGASPTAGTATPAPLAVLVELEAGPAGSAASRNRRHPARVADLEAGAELWLGLRPLTRGRTGSWVKSDLSWRALEAGPASRRLDPVQAEALARVFAAASSERSYSSGTVEHLWLNTITSPLPWQALTQARRAGVELLPGPGLEAVSLLSEAEAGLELRTAPEPDLDLEAEPEPGELEIAARITLAGETAPGARLLGGAGVILAEPGSGDALVVRLAPLADTVPRTLRALLQRREPLRVPAADRETFLETAYPRLRALTEVTSTDPGLALPAAPRPTLHLEAAYADGDRLRLSWSWHYHDPDRVLPMDPRQGARRDREHERAVLECARELWPRAGAEGPELLSGPDTARFSEHVLDDLAELDHVETAVVGTRHAYRELDGAPHVRVTQQSSPGKRDWFDLGFEVTIGERVIPFPSLFTALARGQDRVLMPDRTYFSLDDPAFDALRELIREGEALAEWEPEQQRISRFQVDLWNELEEIAQESTAAASWRSSVGALSGLDALPSAPRPAGLHAELRDYQREGLAWLTFLFEQGLGGVLADDMGLGKTLQTLALIAHARERAATAGEDAPPFLVVTPASVLPVWRREAERFTPDLDVRVLDRTARARGTDPAAEIAGADLVVTSYAVLRIDEEAFAGPRFSGLVLDEAQFVKNRRSRTHRAAAGVRAGFRLAITGTPMENSLADLFAIMNLVAPGLLGTAIGFRREYTLPIEGGEHPERMTRLRRRIRPFLLRRTKERVAAELPEKQEQVLTVTLGAEHRALYDSVLQRERKKVLGLIESDLDRSRFIVFRSLTLLRMLALDPRLVDGEAHAEVTGSKLEALLDRLEEVIGDGHRVLLFSQFTSYLGLVGEALAARGIDFASLDGSTRDRDGVVSAFREGAAPVFLISLKAGGFGLTLTEADYVFLLDPWWNPAAEAQAVDRAHRIGQDRTVMVYRMVAEDTIEEKVLALQRRKAELFDALTDGGDAFRTLMTAEDIRGLLA